MRWQLFLLGTALAFVSATAFAQSSNTGTATVNANVVSSVSVSNSSVVTDLSSLPADGVSSAIITVTVVDENNAPLPQKEVIVSSNRGAVDNIRCYVGDTLIETNKTTTSASGVARCLVRSVAPGQATFSATAEAVELDDKPAVTFTPLPILQKLKITVKTPGGGTITVVEPPKVEPKPGQVLDHTSGDTQLVDTGINIEVPFGLFIFFILLLLLVPILFVILILLIRRIRRMVAAGRKSDEQEKEWLARIYQLEQQIAQQQQIVTTKIDAVKSEVDSQNGSALISNQGLPNPTNQPPPTPPTA